MRRDVPLSSKLSLIVPNGYALAASRQPGYAFQWHAHDCAMLLWPRTGALDSAWEASGTRRRGRLARGQALLLPAYVSHSTRSSSAMQQHGELYLAPELLRDCKADGALQLDGAAQAMLDALWMPALSAQARPGLIRALIEQPPRGFVAGTAMSIGAAVAGCPGLVLDRWPFVAVHRGIRCSVGRIHTDFAARLHAGIRTFAGCAAAHAPGQPGPRQDHGGRALGARQQRTWLRQQRTSRAAASASSG